MVTLVDHLKARFVNHVDIKVDHYFVQGSPLSHDNPHTWKMMYKTSSIVLTRTTKPLFKVWHLTTPIIFISMYNEVIQ